MNVDARATKWRRIMDTRVPSKRRVHNRCLWAKESEGGGAVRSGEVHGAAVVRDNEGGALEEGLEPSNGELTREVQKAPSRQRSRRAQDLCRDRPLSARAG